MYVYTLHHGAEAPAFEVLQPGALTDRVTELSGRPRATIAYLLRGHLQRRGRIYIAPARGHSGFVIIRQDEVSR